MSEWGSGLAAQRKRAEDLLRQQPEELGGSSPDEIRRLVHELRVHQLELEMQNEELRRTQLELEASRGRYVDLYDFAPVGYLTVGESNLILEANLTAATMLRAERGRLIGQPLTRVIAGEDQDTYYHFCKRLLETLSPQVCEVRLVKKDGTPFHARMEATAANGDCEAPVIRVTVSDITELKRAEAERLEMERRLLHAQKLESLGVLAGGIAHDFNNLLAVVLGRLDMALLELPPESDARAHLDEALQASRRAADLTRQMLAYSGRGQFVVKRVDLSGLVSENAHLLRASTARTAAMSLRLAPGLPAVLADPGQLQQVVMNLITNASEAIGQKAGVITLRTGVEDCDGAYLSLSLAAEKPPPGKFVYLEVSDTGCGMGAATLHRLFDPFFTTKFKGRGLGMSAVLGIVRGHKGAIMVHSKLGRGTTVRVLFPEAEVAVEVEAGSAERVGTLPPVAVESTSSGTVLAVDDEEGVRNLCRAMVERLGFRVLTAADGEEALSLFREHAGDVACVILDLTMPRMDGVTAFRELKRIRPDVKVILSSGYSEREATQRFTGEGLTGFIQKPYQLETLAAKVQEVLAKD